MNTLIKNNFVHKPSNTFDFIPNSNINTNTKELYDSCYSTQKNNDNFSIFNYYTDTSMYINVNHCDDFTPPFITYIPKGVPERNYNINIENDLKGLTRNNSRCIFKKYIPNDPSLASRLDNITLFHNQACSDNFKILPNGYINTK